MLIKRMKSPIFLRLYDFFESHRRLLFGIVMCIVLLLSGLVTRLSFKEDITDFLPVDRDYKQAMQIYQEVAAGDRVVLQFSLADTAVVDMPYVADAVRQYGSLLKDRDTAHWVADWQPQIDYTQVSEVFTFIYENLPYFLTEEDYHRADSLWATREDYVAHRLSVVYDRMSSASGAFMQPMLQNDPLGLGSHLAQSLRSFQPQLHFEQHDGYTFTPDGKCCLVTITSPFGSSETQGNAALQKMLLQTGDDLRADARYADIRLHLVGSPVIAVSNADRIKQDSITAVLISAVLILLLLFYAFRDLHALWQILISTGFGFLFAMGFLSLFRDSISLIVLGIASVIIGIAVNYPLHYVCHLRHQPDSRLTLRQLITPLFIGNVTTVGAFLTLLPLDATALCDLGLFSALMLVGTILFVLIVLPHIVRGEHLSDETLRQIGHLDEDHHFSDRWTRHLVRSRWSLALLVVVTCILGYYSSHTSFDTDFSHINYMTDRQRSDLASLSAWQKEPTGTVVYVAVSSPDVERSCQAMERLQSVIRTLPKDTFQIEERNPSCWLPSRELQQHRLSLWRDFWQRHGYGDGLPEEFLRLAAEKGFTSEAFAPLDALLREDLPLLDAEDFRPLTSTILTTMVRDSLLVAQYTVAPAAVERLETALKQAASTLARGEQTADDRLSGCAVHVFDLPSLHARLARGLSDNFNYIGLACGAIVFLFLWLSFRRLEIAFVAFLPMVIGWIWILGLMALLDIRFNIVNVILATFIFGQGDDYTIFITEGLIREHREGHRVLVSYRKSILLSALIMLAGIGSLIFAQHPAMHSLAEVTIIGMLVVVVMAWWIPPMLFHWLIRVDAPLRRYLTKTSEQPSEADA